MLGLGLVVAGAGGPADDPGTTLAGEEEDDGPIIPGVMIKKATRSFEPCDVVRYLVYSLRRVSWAPWAGGYSLIKQLTQKSV